VAVLKYRLYELNRIISRVVSSTLVIAALFNPLRKRVQRAVDRRFNRARYDAEAVVAAFAARLRGTIDLDTMRGDLADVVGEAFQPGHVSVWLPGAGPHAPVPAPAPPGVVRATRLGPYRGPAAGHPVDHRRGAVASG
jgi:hypothetical protein